jgi:hypothetical protein
MEPPQIDDTVQQILQRTRAAVSQAGGLYQFSRTPGREDCVAYGPSYQVPSAIAAAVRVQLVAMEGTELTSGIRCHIVRKGGMNYDLTGHRNYQPRFDPRRSPQTRVIMHVELGS